MRILLIEFSFGVFKLCSVETTKMKKKRKFMSPVGSFQPACGGTCLIDHAEGDLVYVTYLLV